VGPRGRRERTDGGRHLKWTLAVAGGAVLFGGTAGTVKAATASPAGDGALVAIYVTRATINVAG
jgi:hypothetical protein